MRRSRACFSGACQVLAHVPDLVFSGSKPKREVARTPSVAQSIADNLRDVEVAASYLPNQVFIGATPPKPLTEPDAPWWNQPGKPVREGSFGLLFSQDEFLTAMERVDSAGLLQLTTDRSQHDAATVHGRLVTSLSVSRQNTKVRNGTAQIWTPAGPLGFIGRGYPGDEALAGHIVLENLAAKASAALALQLVLDRHGTDPTALDLVISCSEEAVGDRYQRGGGNLGKAIAEAVGATRASGFDIKNFCAAPLSALVVAAGLIEAGVVETVAVVAGGSLPKLGMKFQGHLRHGMPVLEDCLGGVAALLGRDTPGPTLRLDVVGRHSVGAGGSNQRIYEGLVFGPLEAVGLKAVDVDAFGTELHNPELTEPQGSGNVPLRNYRIIAALAAQRHHIDTAEIGDFLRVRTFAGYAPTQGHIASGSCLLPHLLHEMEAGRIQRAQLIAKASLFLGKMCTLSDGVSILIES